MPHSEDLIPWLTLKAVKGVGNITFKKLLRIFKEPHLALSAKAEELMEKAEMNEGLASRISRAAPDRQILEEIELARKSGIKIITFNNADYPLNLKEIADPPPLLYVLGDLAPDVPRIAVVGSRNATYYGIETAHRIGKSLSGFGIETVSGMARGIDTSAHEGAISGGGKTIAVLGSGLHRIYPPENSRLFQKISENGAVLSELSLKTAPDAKNFPMRNRIICGLSSGVVVVEAGSRSGSLITARLAAEQGREVFAVPGNINSGKSSGTHSLLKQGATLIEKAEDIIEELPYLCKKEINKTSVILGKDSSTTDFTTDLDQNEKNILAICSVYPLHMDEIGRKSGLGAGKVACILLELELKGLVHQLPGKLYALKEDKNWQNR